MKQETARQKFIRNHDESIRVMRAKLAIAEENGNAPYAAQCHKIIEAWERIGEQAKRDTVNELVQKTAQELSMFRNMGVTSLKEIQETLAKYGLSLRQEKN